MPSRWFVSTLLVALVTVLSVGAVQASDECIFTKGMMKSVELFKQVRDLHTAHQDYAAVVEQIEKLQVQVIDICVKELKEATEHHPGAFVKLCTKAANLPTADAKCDDSFITNGWDLLAFWRGLKLFKTQLQDLILNAQNPTQKALFEKYLAFVKELREKAKVRHHQLFANDGCDGSCGG